MSRPLSATAAAAIYAQETDVVFHTLMTIDHPDLASPIWVCDDSRDVYSRQLQFQWFPFQITLPAERDDSPPKGQLIIDNTSRLLIQAIRSLDSPPSVKIELVTNISPDIVEYGPLNFLLHNVTYNALTMRGDLHYVPVLDERYPKDIMSPSQFPALF